MNNIEQYWTILDNTGQYWTVLDNMKQYWMILGYDMDILAIWGCGFKILVSLILSQVIANNLTSFWG